MVDSTRVGEVGADGVLLLSTVEGEAAGSEQPESKAITLSEAPMLAAILFMIHSCSGIRLRPQHYRVLWRGTFSLSAIRRSFRDQSSVLWGALSYLAGSPSSAWCERSETVSNYFDLKKSKGCQG